MYLCHFLTSVDSTKPFASGSRVPLLSTSTQFSEKGDSILILILYLMRDLGRHRVKHHCSLLSLAPITFDANTFSCYGGSYFATIAVIFYHLPKTSELGRAINARIIVAASYRDHYLLFRVCSFAELSSAFIITAPEGAAVVYTNTSVIIFQSYITRAWGMPASFVHSCIFYAPYGRSGSTSSFLFQRIALTDPTIALSYNNILSRRNIDGFRLYVCS
jgi:hypothetical protein